MTVVASTDFHLEESRKKDRAAPRGVLSFIGVVFVLFFWPLALLALLTIKHRCHRCRADAYADAASVHASVSRFSAGARVSLSLTCVYFCWLRY